MKKLMVRILLACLFLGAYPSTSYAAYAYNYGINYDRSVWADNLDVHHDFTDCAAVAAGYQDQKGYVDVWYNDARAEWIYNNLGVVAVSNLIGHGNASWVMPIQVTASGIHATALTSSFSLTGQWWAPAGASPAAQIESSSQVVQLNNSPARLVVYQSCLSGADPPAGYNLLYATTGYADADCAVGFKKAILVCAGGSMSAMYDWQYKYWSALGSGYYAGYSQELAENYIFTRWGATPSWALPEYGQVWGYGEHFLFGNANVQL